MNKTILFVFFSLSLIGLVSSSPTNRALISDWPSLELYLNKTINDSNTFNYSNIKSTVILSEPEYYVTGDNCGNLSFWNFSTGNLDFQYQLPLGNLNGSNLSLICSLPERTISNILSLENSKKIVFSANNNLYVFDVQNRIAVKTSFYHSRPVVSLAYLRKRDWWVSADSFGSIAYWDAAGNYIQSINMYYGISQLESEYDSNFLLVTSLSSFFYIINIESNHVMKSFRTSRDLKTVLDLKFTDFVAFAYTDNTLDILNKHSGKAPHLASYFPISAPLLSNRANV